MTTELNTDRVLKVGRIKQAAYVSRARELQSIIDGAKDELSEIVEKFKRAGDGDYLGTDGHLIQVRTSVANRLDSKIARTYLTEAQIRLATKRVFSTAAKVI